MGRLQGKTALVTGGTSGIGLETAKLFVAEGAKVAVTGLDPERLETTRAELGPEALVFGADVSDRQAMETVAARIRETWGHLDVVFANAGVFRAAPIERMDEATMDLLLGTNFKGVVHTVQATLPLLAPGASVIFTSSAVDSKGYAGMSLYAATKAAVRSLARSLSAELVDRGIRVNVVAPGAIETPIWGRTGLPQEVVDGMAAGIKDTNPMKRFGKPSEIARTVLFLASDDSSYILGQNLYVDGGTQAL
ncbi:MAG: SDR family oxidoreductase [Fibrobacteria bacterium]|nr:SDR family oxidoreductase [Fibrobacteria bacterium]